MPFNNASSGHKLGQVIGDWFERYVALPILSDVCDKLGLFLDNRFIDRPCRTVEKVLWPDAEGNQVDFDFVIELHGSSQSMGVPIAFFESFWRRGARHSKDKARDDSGKLLPMKSTYSTARVLGIISAGDFTEPARDFVRTRNIDLYYFPKRKILDSWSVHGLEIDYPDRSTEEEKSRIVNKVCSQLEQNPNLYPAVANSLFNIVGKANINAYKQRLISLLGATPLTYSIIVERLSNPYIFDTYIELEEFLSNGEPTTIEYNDTSYNYEVVFGDGDSFNRDGLSWKEVVDLHNKLKKLIVHMEEYFEKI